MAAGLERLETSPEQSLVARVSGGAGVSRQFLSGIAYVIPGARLEHNDDAETRLRIAPKVSAGLLWQGDRWASELSVQYLDFGGGRDVGEGVRQSMSLSTNLALSTNQAIRASVDYRKEFARESAALEFVMAAVFLMASVVRAMSFSRVFVLIFVFVLSACESLLFFPQQQLVRSPADVGLAYADVRIAIADGGTVSAWWLPAEGKAEATVLFAHGNAENISTHLASVYWLPARGINVLLIDYRGYGQSYGEASVRGAQMDILAALQHLSRSRRR